MKYKESSYKFTFFLLYGLLCLCALGSIFVGRIQMPFSEIQSYFLSLLGLEELTNPLTDRILGVIRLPRIFLAVLVGGALALSGASYQTLFKNPLVSPSILGVSSGAAFGAALAMVIDAPWWQIQLFSLLFGLLAVVFANFISYIFGGRGLTVLILGGVVVSSLFGSMLSIVKLAADTENALPSIAFWLMGSMGRATFRDVLMMMPALFLSIGLLYVFRYQIDALAAGEDEALSMGVNIPLVKGCVIFAATLMTAVSVSVCGIVGWIGMIVPHMARFLIGASFPRLLWSSFALGGIFLLLIDDMIRGIPKLDLPLGVMTSIIGTPIFVFFLSKVKKGWG